LPKYKALREHVQVLDALITSQDLGARHARRGELNATSPLRNAGNAETKARNAFTARNLQLPQKDLLAKILILSLLMSKVGLVAMRY
jgi:hypothetical protein